MSLIVAKCEDNAIVIVSDTKLTIPVETNNRFGLRNHRDDGVVKSILVNGFCISFAGVVEFAEDALKQITINDTLQSILDLLLIVNRDTLHETEFIVAASTQKPQIFEIKNGICQYVNSAWIGSLNGFARFQRGLTSATPSIEGQSTMSISLDAGISNSMLFHKMNQALDEVIEDDEIPEVAGFRISVVLDKEKFKYTGYIKSYWSRRFVIGGQNNYQPQKNFITHGNASEGAYTINVFIPFGPVNAIGIHVKQGEFGIVYSNANGGLMRPVTVYCDELDFVEYVADNFQLSPIGITQDAEAKYAKEGSEAFNSKDYFEAIRLYNKGLDINKGAMAAKFQMAKAQAFFLLSFNNEGLVCLNEAIKINPLLESVAIKMANQFKIRYNK